MGVVLSAGGKPSPLSRLFGARSRHLTSGNSTVHNSEEFGALPGSVLRAADKYPDEHPWLPLVLSPCLPALLSSLPEKSNECRGHGESNGRAVMHLFLPSPVIPSGSAITHSCMHLLAPGSFCPVSELNGGSGGC